MSAASGEASATAQSEFAEMITLSVKYRVETVQRNAKMHERSEKGSNRENHLEWERCGEWKETYEKYRLPGSSSILLGLLVG